MPLSFYSHLQVPDGAIATMQYIIDTTYGKRSICPLGLSAIALGRGKCRETISLHVRFWEDLKQLRLERYRRGDSRRFRIVLCFRERGEDIRNAADLLIQALPEKGLGRRTFKDFKAERAKKGRKTVNKRRLVKESRGEYVA